MPLRQLLILLPCHSLEDFPTYHEGDDAQGLLAGWTSLWHPNLIHLADEMPTWARVDEPPEDVSDTLLVVPGLAVNEMPSGFARRAKESGATLIRREQDRSEIIAKAFAALTTDAFQPPQVDEQLVADFLALGYYYLQIQLLTRQMRYASNLDEVFFRDQLVAAAHAAVSGDAELAKAKLAACFDTLAEERDHFYPVDIYLIDLVLVAESTLGEPLETELGRSQPLNLLAPSKLLTDSGLKGKLQAAVASGNIGIVSGTREELREPMLAVEDFLSQLRAGRDDLQEICGDAPAVYGRRRYGLTPHLPMFLNELGYKGALHSTLDDGQFPEGSQIKIAWESHDGSTIEAFARPPVSGTKPETFLSLGVKMGESMDMDHVATVCFAHWAGQGSEWLEDLRNGSKYGPALGSFVTLAHYFEATDAPYHGESFFADQYREPYLKQAIIRGEKDPVSRWTRYWRRRAQFSAIESLHGLATLVSSQATDAPENFSARILKSVETPPKTDCEDESLDDSLNAALTAASEKFAASLPRRGNATAGVLAMHPGSYVRRSYLSTSHLSAPPAVDRPVFTASKGSATDSSNSQVEAVVDVPAAGFAWLEATATKPRRSKKVPPLGEAGVLRNEYFEAVFNTQTGGLRSIIEYGRRGNRMSQQLAMRLPTTAQAAGDIYVSSDSQDPYTDMQADKLELLEVTPTHAKLRSDGRLVAGDEVLATFEQTFTVWKGRRVLGLEITVAPLVDLRADPRNSYIASRFAWNDQTGNLHRTVNEFDYPTSNRQFIAPHYIDVSFARGRTTVLTGGLPYHRVTGPGMLDSLLVLKGESEQTFQMGIAIDLKDPMAEAQNLLMPPLYLEQTAAPPVHTSGWLLHVDARNVHLSHLQPWVENDEVVGFKVRIFEQAGRATKCKLEALRPIGHAIQMDFRGEGEQPLEISDGVVELNLSPRRFIEVWSRWKV